MNFDTIFTAWEAIADRPFTTPAEAEGFRDGFTRVVFDRFAAGFKPSASKRNL